eukprot:IDg21037t1
MHEFQMYANAKMLYLAPDSNLILVGMKRENGSELR